MFVSFLGHTQAQDSYWESAGKKFDNKDYQGALIDYQKAHNIKKDAGLAYNIGLCLKYLEDYKGAIYSFSEAIQLKPDNIDAYDQRGIVKFNTEDFYGAISDKYRAIELDEDNGENARRYLYVGIVKVNLKDDNGANSDFEKALKIVPQIEKELMAELYWRIGLNFEGLEKVSEAKENYLKSIEIFPSMEAYKRLIYVSGYESKTIEYLSEAIKLFPNEAVFYFYRGKVHTMLDNHYAAISDFMRYNDLQTEENNLVEGYNGIALVKEKISDYKGAIDDHSKTLAIMIANTDYWPIASIIEVYMLRGKSKKNLEDYIGALDDYSKAIEFAMKNEYEEKNEQIRKIWIAKYFLMLDLQDPDGAIAEISKYLDYGLNIEENFFIEEAYYYRGQHKIRFEDYEGAIDEHSKQIKYASALNDNKKISQAYNKRGEGYWNINDFNSAIEDFSKAIELHEDENYYTNRGESLGEIGKYAEAMVDINKALEINPEYGWAYEERGIIKKYLNDLEGACADWKIGKKLGYDYVSELIEKNCN